MLGHKSIATTQKYLGVNYASVREALQKMSLDGELHESGLLGTSLKSTKDETLFLELALRGTISRNYEMRRRLGRLLSLRSIEEKDEE